jgi:hypothetical protein
MTWLYHLCNRYTYNTTLLLHLLDRQLGPQPLNHRCHNRQ